MHIDLQSPQLSMAELANELNQATNPVKEVVKIRVEEVDFERDMEFAA